MKFCWCGEEKHEVISRGNWRYLHYVLGECQNCSAIRTIGYDCISSKPAPNLDLKNAGLGPRHMASLKTIKENYIDGNLLDVGCGDGKLDQYIRKNYSGIKKIKAVEKSRLIFGLMEKIDGIEYGNETILDMNNDEKYENIVSTHCFEHVKNIVETLQKCEDLSSENAMLYISVPNVEYVNFTNFLGFSPDEHCWHFTKKSIRNLLEKVLKEFKIVGFYESKIWDSRDQLEVVLKK